MKRSGWLAGFAALMVVAVTVFYVLWRTEGSPAPPKASGAIDTDLLARSDSVTGAMPTSAAERAELGSSRDGRIWEAVDSSTMDRLDRVWHTSQLDFDLLLLRAQGGDTQAMAAVIALAGRCGPFWPIRGDRYHARHAVEQAAVGTAERAARETAVELLASYCDVPYPQGELSEGRIPKFSSALRERAEQGDLLARAHHTFEEESEADVLAVLSASHEPWLIERALQAFAEGRGEVARQLDREIFPPELSLQRSEVERIKWMAARWRACELGAACGPNQYHELSQCLYLGNCGLGMDVRTYIQQRELSGWQFELMQKYLAALDARLAEQGIRLGGGR
jgi:hypothetical protein